MTHHNNNMKVSFHCNICYDAFNLEHRPPVVLPCGHTYVCKPCSKRIDKCPECRTSLVLKVSSTSPSQNQPVSPLLPHRNTNYNAHTYSGRYRSQPFPSSPPHASKSPANTIEKIPLPIPTNIVLMSIMESSSLHKRKKSKNLFDFSFEQSDGEDEDQSDDEDVTVIHGLQILSGSSGTYAVRDKNGLHVHVSDPKRKVDEKTGTNSSFDATENESVRRSLIYGQRVQVVDANGGVYKLARDEGYILASSSQLVKVGPPLEKCCKVESTIRSVSASKQELLKKLEELEKVELSLRNELKDELTRPPVHPVIENCLSVLEVPASTDLDPNSIELYDSDQLSPMSKPSEDDIRNIFSSRSPATPSNKKRTPISSPSSVTVENTNYTSSPARSKMSTLTKKIYDRTTASPPFTRLSMCGSSLFPILHDDDDQTDNENRNSGISQPTLNGRPSSTGTPIFIPQRHNKYDIDFRTGMSGHLALNSTRKLNQNTEKGEIRMMSEHRGIATIKPIRKYTLSPKIDTNETW